MHKRAHLAKRKALKFAEILEVSQIALTTELINIAAKYIPTEHIIDFSNEVRTFLDEHHKKEL